ncbi:MAG: nucleoside phosphorylase [Bdellovibrionota bacterium]
MSTFQNAQNIETKERRQYHLPAGPGDLASNIMLVGDPARCEAVASHFSSTRYRDSHRELTVITGTYQGLDVSVVSTGMGDGSTEICVVEICKLIPAPTLIRCGTSGILDASISLGDLIITSAALRLSNLLDFYVPSSYPSVSNLEVQCALIQSAKKHGAPFHHGLTATAPGFYAPQGRVIEGFPVQDPQLPEKLGTLGVKNLEMEAATIFGPRPSQRSQSRSHLRGHCQSSPKHFLHQRKKSNKPSAKAIAVALDAFVELQHRSA